MFRRAFSSRSTISNSGFFFVTSGLDPVVDAERRLSKTSPQNQSSFTSAWIAGRLA